tara:strand:- start:150 stop:314 length:165 start_codon:yes stop_codon:yes gene_type:complete
MASVFVPPESDPETQAIDRETIASIITSTNNLTNSMRLLTHGKQVIKGDSSGAE